MNSSKKQFAINVLRRGSYKWHTRWKAEKRSKIGRNEYYCESCGMVGPKRSTQMDHHIPVVDPKDGFIGFDSYIDRLYPDDEWGWRRLCIPCHSEKTNKENGNRKKVRKKRLTNKK